jgi:hypothetical protein
MPHGGRGYSREGVAFRNSAGDSARRNVGVHAPPLLVEKNELLCGTSPLFQKRSQLADTYVF